jgi:carbamoylphosphate synthase large subunit
MAAQWLSIEAAIQTVGMVYPMVANPDIGCRGAGVRPVRSPAELRQYAEEFPIGETFLIQRMIDVEGEAGVFYVRDPGSEKAGSTR